MTIPWLSWDTARKLSLPKTAGVYIGVRPLNNDNILFILRKTSQIKMNRMYCFFKHTPNLRKLNLCHTILGEAGFIRLARAAGNVCNWMEWTAYVKMECTWGVDSATGKVIFIQTIKKTKKLYSALQSEGWS